MFLMQLATLERMMHKWTIGPDADTVSTSVITMDENVVIDELTVTLNIEHTWNSDLDVKLIGPDGTEAILFQDVGGSEDNFTNTVLKR